MNARKYLLYVSATIALVGSAVLYRTLEFGRGDAKPALLENLNPSGEMTGPEGICLDALGGIYIGDAQGIIWKLGSDGIPRVYARLDQVLQSMESDPQQGAIQSGGIVFDPAGNLYVAAYGFAGGSILRVETATRQVRLFARDLGVAKSVLTTGDGSRLWVSDYRRRGRLLRYSLSSSFPAQPDQIIAGLETPNGIATSADEKILYVAETYSGNIVQVDLAAAEPVPKRVLSLKGSLAIGSLAGLAFDPRDQKRRFLYIAENLRGLFTVLDLHANPVRITKQIRLAAMGGRPCPASMVISNGYLHFTDPWSCSPIRILLGIPPYREHAYRFRVTDLTALF